MIREFYSTRLPVPASKTDSSYRYGYEKTFLENHNIFENVFGGFKDAKNYMFLRQNKVITLSGGPH